jgi:hypothetical protein
MAMPISDLELNLREKEKTVYSGRQFDVRKTSSSPTARKRKTRPL